MKFIANSIEEHILKRTLFFIILVAVLAGCTKTEKQPPSEIILSQELDALTRWSHGDPWGYIDLAAPEITYFAEGIDTLIVGYDAFKAVNEPFEGKFNIPTIKIRNPKIDMHGDIGILTYTLINQDKDGQETSRWKSTEIYEKRDDGWKLVHSHWTIVK